MECDNDAVTAVCEIDVSDVIALQGQSRVIQCGGEFGYVGIGIDSVDTVSGRQEVAR
jgi:hypothetical protein